MPGTHAHPGRAGESEVERVGGHVLSSPLVVPEENATMPIGPDGEKRPTDVIANTVHVMRVGTGEAEETCVNPGKGGVARAQPLSA